MEEQIISFETAILAKEKGFNWSCNYVYPALNYNNKAERLNYFQGDGSGFTTNSAIQKETDYLDDDTICTAPTQSFLQKWLRDNRMFDITVYLQAEGYSYYLHEDRSYREKSNFHGRPTYITYEEALEKGLQEALKLIK